jgi:hypothetical protein
MPLASAHAPLTNEPPSQALGRQPDAAHAHQTVEQHAHDKSQGQPAFHAHGDAHDHSVPHTHGPRPSGSRVEVSPVLVGVGARVLAVCALLSLLWLAIFWAFVGNV